MLRWGGSGVVVGAMLARCLVVAAPFPYWDIDPGRVSLPVTGITPALSISLEVVTLIAAAAVLIGEVLAGGSLLVVPFVLWALGTFGALVQGLWLRAGTVDDLRIASSWIAAMAGGVAAIHACRDPRLKRLTLAAAFGIVAMLAAKGALQVYVEHADTIARYRQDRATFLISQGWDPASVAAKNFERRLNQPEATGWFGLSNVFATISGAAIVALLGCTVIAWREARVTRRVPDGWAGVLTLGTAAAGLALMLAGSKGGFTGAGIGLGMLAVYMLLLQRERSWVLTPRAYGVLATMAIATVLAAVAVRGVVGEKFGELSLLFRWFYMEGAARAFAEGPLWGTGPDGFKDAYMRLKPALSPEEVSSPHSVLLDFGATLGVFGLAWGALWLSWVWGIGASLGEIIHRRQPDEMAKDDLRSDAWFVGLSIAGAVLFSTWLERHMGSPEQAVTKLVGLGSWFGLAVATMAVMRVNRRTLGVMAIGAMAAALHGQIEVTPIWYGSAGWIALVLGACSAGVRPGLIVARRAPALAAPASMIAVAACLAWFGVAPMTRWETALRDASDRMRPLAEITERLTELRSGRPPSRAGDSMSKVLEELGAMTESLPPATPQELQRGMDVLSMKCGKAACELLERAAAMAPHHFATTEAWCRQLMLVSAAEASLGKSAPAQDDAARAAELARRFAGAHRTSSAFGLLGNVEASRYDFSRDPRHLTQAVAAWTQAVTLDPHGTTFPLRIFRALIAAGRTTEARLWAAMLVELDQLQRLDPLKRLSDDEMSAVKAALEGK